ncbi:GH1 family beta-glucosidase [Streptomyces chromofuscus]|uniref:Beta-glucosidase n=1 Tax=Streptomyces chromofuscus TaxID=42881 RepID=A0A7M2TAA1_STRCW|nr:GH1 family beta-glucosidase [Streptomyces chromofuscus]QOV44648.1 beta-glucosidase [Streptomyces chromofuscus]GGT01478.1 beta-glucosidase [Streptomyces chromofuscus]
MSNPPEPGSSGLPGFPEGFFFGAATASYQIEGAHDEDGRGPSIWDTFSREPGRVARGATGDVACDHYHRYREDVALLRELGVDSYRFSLAWPRVQPTGSGPANPAGLDFYDRLVDELLAAGISPAATLYHWDLPQALEDRGGWRVRETAERFAEYTALAADRLADRVDRWITLNEPFCSAFVGYAAGGHAPGAREGRGALAAAHHLLVGHGLAVRALRAAGAREVGITLNPDRLLPATDSAADLAAVRRVETLHNDVWFEPLFAGRYPAHETETWGELLEKGEAFRRDGDLALIGAPLDFVGINYYRPITVADAPHKDPDPATRTAVDVRAEESWRDDVRHTTMGWPVVPHTFTDLLVELSGRYPALPPILITENGSAEADTVDAEGRVRDTDRIEYLRSHLEALATALREGVDVRGYYVWSLLDNFEWARGYEQRFGIVRVDYDTQRRIPKDSYHWYRGLIAAHRARTGTTRS